MIGTIVGTYYGTRKGWGWGASAALGIGVDFAVGLGLFLLTTVAGLTLLSVGGQTGQIPVNASVTEAGYAAGSALAGMGAFGAAGRLAAHRVRPRAFGAAGRLAAVRVR